MDELKNEPLPEPIGQEGYFQYYDAKEGVFLSGTKKYETMDEWSSRVYESYILKKVTDE